MSCIDPEVIIKARIGDKWCNRIDDVSCELFETKRLDLKEKRAGKYKDVTLEDMMVGVYEVFSKEEELVYFVKESEASILNTTMCKNIVKSAHFKNDIKKHPEGWTISNHIFKDSVKPGWNSMFGPTALDSGIYITIVNTSEKTKSCFIIKFE